VLDYIQPMMLMRLPIAALLAARLLLLLVLAGRGAVRDGCNRVITIFNLLCRGVEASLFAASSSVADYFPVNVTIAKAGAPLDREPESRVPAFAGMTDSWCVEKIGARRATINCPKKGCVPFSPPFSPPLLSWLLKCTLRSPFMRGVGS
jgi:hypothetical protein